MVNNKGKSRVIFINKKLRRLLLDYCREEAITSGSIFVTKNGRPMDRSNIWHEMKKLCIDGSPYSFQLDSVYKILNFLL